MADRYWVGVIHVSLWSVGPLRGELLRAAPPPKAKLRLAALAKRSAQPYDVVVLEGPDSPDELACVDPCVALSDAQANGAGDEATRGCRSRTGMTRFRLWTGPAGISASFTGEATSLCKGAAAVVAASRKLVVGPARESVVRANPKPAPRRPRPIAGEADPPCRADRRAASRGWWCRRRPGS